MYGTRHYTGTEPIPPCWTGPIKKPPSPRPKYPPEYNYPSNYW